MAHFILTIKKLSLSEQDPIVPLTSDFKDVLIWKEKVKHQEQWDHAKVMFTLQLSDLNLDLMLCTWA